MKCMILFVFIMASLIGCKSPISTEPVPIPPPGVEEEVEVDETDAPEPKVVEEDCHEEMETE